MQLVFVLLVCVITLVAGAPRIKRQYYYPYYQYRQPFTTSYFHGQPVYDSDYGYGGYGFNDYYHYRQPSYRYYYRQPVYYSGDYYGGYEGPYYNGGILGFAGSLISTVLG
ncbi:hypothetical protein V3C99_017538 [Haemonchus contortus]|nr:unnamed protein product [Haemonchus contortus]